MRYRVLGVDSATGEDREVVVEAQCERDALGTAKTQGILATEVTPHFLPQQGQTIASSNRPPRRSMASILAPYVNASICVNFRNAEKFETATLVDVGEDHFTVCDHQSGVFLHFPFQMIVSVVEQEHTVVVQVFHLIIYKGGIGVGVGIGIGL